MNNQRDIQIFELANRLINLDVTTLSEQQLQHRNDMLVKLKEEIKMLDEASLAQMRDYFSLTDPKVRSVSPTAKYVANTDPKAQVNMQKRFRSQAEYEEWLEKNGLKQISGVKKEGIADIEDAGEYDQEGDMAKQDLATAANAAEELRSILDSDENLPEWVQSKITKAVDYLDTVRDYMKSKDQDVTEDSQRVDSLVTDALRIMKGSEVSDAVQALKTVLGDREYNGRRGHYNFYVRQILDMYNQQGVAEGSDNITAVFSGYGNYMSGRGANIFKHYGITVLDKQYFEDEDIAEYTVSGSKEALDQARAYLERSDQFGGMIIKQGVAEAKKPSPKLTPVNIKKTDPVSEEINTEAYERLQKVFAFKNYES